MATPEQLETLKKEVRSVLLSQTDGKGIPQHKFIKHYRDLLMKPLNYRALGHKNLVELLENMPDVARIEYHPKTNDAHFFGVLDKTSYVGVGARKASEVKMFSTNGRENQKTDFNSNEKKGLKSGGSSDKKAVRSKSKGSQNKGRSRGNGGRGDQNDQNSSSKDKMAMQSDRTNYDATCSSLGENSGSVNSAELKASSPPSKGGKDLKSGLSPNMKGMWAICFQKGKMGDKSREDLIDVFAEAGEVAECGMSPNYVFIRYWSRESASKAIDLFGQEYGVIIPEEKSASRPFNENKNRRKPDQTHGDRGDSHQGHGNQETLGNGNPQDDKTTEKEKNLDLLTGYYGEGTVKTPPRDKNNNKEKRNSGERAKSRNSSGSTTSSGQQNYRTLFIGHVKDSGKTKEEVEQMLEKYKLEQMRFFPDRGYCFAKFATREGGEKCMEDSALYFPLRFEWAKEESHPKTDDRRSPDNDIRDADFDADRARERAQHLELVATNNLKQGTVKDSQKQESPTFRNSQEDMKVGNQSEETKTENKPKPENHQSGQKVESGQNDHKFKDRQGSKNTEGRQDKTTSGGKKGQAVNTEKKSLHSKNYKGYKRRNNSQMNGEVQNGDKSFDDMPGLDDSDEMPELEEEMPELGNDCDDGLGSLSDSYSLAGSGVERGVAVFVAHFPWQTTVEMLMELFRPYQARSVSIKRHPVMTQAFVKISSALSAEQAVRDLNNSFFYGKILHVDISKDEVETFAALLQEEKEAFSNKAMTVCGGMSVLSGGHNLSLPKAMQYESMMDMAATCGNPYYIEGFLRKQFDVLVTSVIDKTYFWGHVQYMVDELRLFQKVREGLQKIPFKTPVPPTISRGMVRNEKEWHRVWIMEDLPSDFARILCIDYGREDVVKRSDICLVPEVFWKVLPMAVPFCMRSGHMPVQSMVVSATLIEKKDYVLHVNLR